MSMMQHSTPYSCRQLRLATLLGGDVPGVDVDFLLALELADAREDDAWISTDNALPTPVYALDHAMYDLWRIVQRAQEADAQRAQELIRQAQEVAQR